MRRGSRGQDGPPAAHGWCARGSDRMSPAHTDSDGNPKEWDVPIGDNPFLWADTAAQYIQQYEDQEANITPEQQGNADQAVANYFRSIFGDVEPYLRKKKDKLVKERWKKE